MNEATMIAAAAESKTNTMVNGATRRIQKARFTGLVVETLLPNVEKGIEMEIRVQARCPFTGNYRDLPELVFRQIEGLVSAGVIEQDKLLTRLPDCPETKNPDRVWRKYRVNGYTAEGEFNIIESCGVVKSVHTNWASVTLVKQERKPITETSLSL